MGDSIYLDNSFVTDVGFDHIREWLSERSMCEENYNHFICLKPTYDKNYLKNEFEFSDELVKALHRKENLPQTRVGQINKILLSLNIKEKSLEVEEIVELRNLLYYFIAVKKKVKENYFKLWSSKLKSLDTPSSILKKIESVIDDNNKIKNNASKELEKIIKSINRIYKEIDKKINLELKKYSKLGYLKENKIIYRADKVTLPVIASFKNKIKGIVDGFSATKKTYFIEPLSLVELNNELNDYLSEKKKEIRKILKKLTSDIAEDKNLVDDIYTIIKYYDIHYTVAMLAVKLDAIIPKFSDKILLKDSVNPLFTLTNKKYVPLNFSSDSRHKTIIISGPNSGGKTIVIKSIGLYSLMAQSGLYIPAKMAVLPIFDSFLSDIGDKQSLDDDLSTFSAHMKKISKIIKKSNQKSLIIIDEMGTGTDPEIGASLSISILDKLTLNESFNLCTTHLTPIKIWANENSNAENASMEFDEKNIEPTFIFIQGIPGSSYGIEIANRMGINKEIIVDASKKLDNKSFKMENLIREINTQQKELKIKLSEIDLIKKELANKEREAEKIKKEFSKKNSEISRDQKTELRKEILRYRKKIESLVENIKKNNANKQSIKEAKKFIEEALPTIDDNYEFKNNTEKINYILGDMVKIQDLNESGTIIKINEKTNDVVVDINNKKLSVNIEQLIPSNQDNRPIQNKKHITQYNVETLDSQRIDLRGMRAHQAIENLDIFIDKALLSNLESIDVLHGKGTGALQEAVHKYLSELKHIGKYYFAPLDQGGSGITIVEFSKK